MKLLHIADLHIGKRLGKFSLIGDQSHIFDKIVQIAENEKTAGSMRCAVER